MNLWLNNKEFAALLQLFNEFRAGFDALPDYMRDAFFEGLKAYEGKIKLS